MEFTKSRIATNRQQTNGNGSQVSPLSPNEGQKAMARELTPAQKRAVAFAQQQVLRAREAQKAQAVRKAELLRLQQDEDKDFEATLTSGSGGRRGAHGESTVISFRRVLGEVLRSLRTKDKKTLREVSERAGVSLGYLSEVERGQKEASSELLGSIANALGMRLSDTLRLVADEIEKLEDAQSRLQTAA